MTPAILGNFINLVLTKDMLCTVLNINKQVHLFDERGRGYSQIAILLATVINDFNADFNEIQKKALDHICQEDNNSNIADKATIMDKSAGTLLKLFPLFSFSIQLNIK